MLNYQRVETIWKHGKKFCRLRHHLLLGQDLGGLSAPGFEWRFATESQASPETRPVTCRGLAKSPEFCESTILSGIWMNLEDQGLLDILDLSICWRCQWFGEAQCWPWKRRTETSVSRAADPGRASSRSAHTCQRWNHFWTRHRISWSALGVSDRPGTSSALGTPWPLSFNLDQVACNRNFTS